MSQDRALTAQELRNHEAASVVDMAHTMLAVVRSDLQQLTDAAIQHAFGDFVSEGIGEASQARLNAMEMAVKALRMLDQVNRMLDDELAPQVAGLLAKEKFDQQTH